jgi:hypothetical protein
MLAADSGITLRPYLGYTAEWAAAGRTGDGQTWNDPPARLADWRDFVRRVARELSHHPNVRSYEIYNEENTKLWWDGTVEEYAATLAAAADELAASHPGAAVLMGGLVWPDADWLEATCGLHGNAERVDVIPLHAYAETWPDSVAIEDYLDPQFDDFIETAAASCGRNTVWINETGFATTPGRSEREQANWWARAVATFAAHPRVEHIGVYEIKDLRKDSPVIGDAPNYHLGLTRTDRTPKLAFRTVDLLTDLLDVGRLVVRDAELDVTVTAGRPGRLFHHLFQRPDGRLVLIVWDRSAAPVLRIGLPRTGRVTEYGLDGTATRFEAVDGRALTGVRLVPGEARIFEIRP